jgi:hypothetical protein
MEDEDKEKHSTKLKRLKRQVEKQEENITGTNDDSEYVYYRDSSNISSSPSYSLSKIYLLKYSLSYYYQPSENLEMRIFHKKIQKRKQDTGHESHKVEEST